VPENASTTPDAALEFAHQLADVAGATLLTYFRQPLAVDNKAAAGDFDPVTAADQAAERVMRTLVQDRFPDHGIIGEEYGADQQGARYQWLFDPIDGTRAFIMGSPLWGTLICHSDDGTPIVGVMNQPFTQERFFADPSGSFFRHGHEQPQRLASRTGHSLSEATLVTTDPELFGTVAERDAFQSLSKHVRLTRYGGDCYNYCLLAAGHVDLVVESGLKAHDIAALVPIIEGAGGVISTWDGGPAGAGGRIVAAGDRNLHQDAMKVLQSSLT
jgi:histidinol-phosphatase